MRGYPVAWILANVGLFLGGYLQKVYLKYELQQKNRQSRFFCFQIQTDLRADFSFLTNTMIPEMIISIAGIK